MGELWAGVARQGADQAVAVRLGNLLGQPQAQLDGFKSRVLRTEAPTQRHLYTTEWCAIGVSVGAVAEVLMILDDEPVECERLLSRVSHAELVEALRVDDWAAVVVATATTQGTFGVLPLFALEAAVACVQMQAVATPAPNVWLLTTDGPQHA